jgi:hypothetical protein
MIYTETYSGHRVNTAPYQQPFLVAQPVAVKAAAVGGDSSDPVDGGQHPGPAPQAAAQGPDPATDSKSRRQAKNAAAAKYRKNLAQRQAEAMAALQDEIHRLRLQRNQLLAENNDVCIPTGVWF